MEKAWKENPRYVRISLCVAVVLTSGLLMTAVYACLQRETITQQNREIARLKAEVERSSSENAALDQENVNLRDPLHSLESRERLFKSGYLKDWNFNVGLSDRDLAGFPRDPASDRTVCQWLSQRLKDVYHCKAVYVWVRGPFMSWEGTPILSTLATPAAGTTEAVAESEMPERIARLLQQRLRETQGRPEKTIEPFKE